MSRPTPNATEPSATPHLPEEDDFDAQEYVRQLIARMEPTETEPLTSNMAAPKPDTTVNERTAPRRERLPRSLEFGVDGESSEDGRARRNEVPIDIEKLREAVNLSTTSQLDRFDRKTLTQRAFVYLGSSLGCMLFSSLFVAVSSGPFTIAHFGSIISLAGAGWATVRYVAATDVLWKKVKLGDLAK